MTREQALARAMKLCSTKEYAPSEMDNKLDEWKVSATDKPWVMEQLLAEKFIDEYRMARYFANDKLRYNKWGKIKIRYMLQQKRVGHQAVSEALGQIDPVEYANILKSELNKKRKELKAEDEYTLRAKLVRFALGRGFEADMIYRFIGE